MVQTDFDVAIVGGGPGGLVSALYLGRFLRKTVVVSAFPPRAASIPKTHNLLGYKGGISGRSLLKRLDAQVAELGCQRLIGEYQVTPEQGAFLLTCNSHTFTAKKVILATGMSDVQPPLENLQHLRVKGILRYCPICDAFEYRRKRIVVLAQDTHGIKTALFLANFSSKITVIWPHSQRLDARLRRHCDLNRLKIVEGTLESIEECSNGSAWVHVGLRSTSKHIAADVCYVALGITVNDMAFRHLHELRRTMDGHLITHQHQELPIHGLYAVGDCVEGLAQITVAAGQAAIASTHIHNQLRSHS